MNTFTPSTTLVGRVWLNGFETDQLQKHARDDQELTSEQYALLNIASNIHRKLVEVVYMFPLVADVEGLTDLLHSTDMAVNKSLHESHKDAGTFDNLPVVNNINDLLGPVAG